MSTFLPNMPRRVIFIIDDDLDMLELNRTILESHGYKVICAQSGEKALFILNRIQPPHLILLDYNLQGMQGPEFLKAFENKHPELLKLVPVVFLTSQSEIPDTKASGVIKKSSDMDGFLRCIDSFMNQRAAAVQQNSL